MRIVRFFATAAILCGLSAAAPAHADAPPYVTTDTDIADKFELKSFIRSVEHEQLNASTLGFDFAIPLTPRWEMSIVPRFVVLSAGSHRSTGMGDTELAVKYLALPETETGPAIAFEPNVTFPTGGHMGDEWVAIELPVLISKTFGPWRVSGQLGYERDGHDARNDHTPMSLLVERTIAKQFSLGVEIANDIPMRRGGPGAMEANLGGSWAIRDGLRLEVVVGRRMESHDTVADLHSCLALAFEF